MQSTTRSPHLMSNQPRTRLLGQLDNGRVSRDSKIQGREPATFLRNHFIVGRDQKLTALAGYIALKTKRMRPEEGEAAHELAELLKLDRV